MCRIRCAQPAGWGGQWGEGWLGDTYGVCERDYWRGIGGQWWSELHVPTITWPIYDLICTISDPLHTIVIRTILLHNVPTKTQSICDLLLHTTGGSNITDEACLRIPSIIDLQEFLFCCFLTISSETVAYLTIFVGNIPLYRWVRSVVGNFVTEYFLVVFNWMFVSQYIF